MLRDPRLEREAGECRSCDSGWPLGPYCWRCWTLHALKAVCRWAKRRRYDALYELAGAVQGRIVGRRVKR